MMNGSSSVSAPHILLIVEDEDLLRDGYASLFTKFFEVIAVSSGEEAFQVIGRLPKIDILLTDFNLQGQLDGLDIARAVKIKNQKTPVVMVSGSDETLPRIQELLSMPNTKLIAKPFHIIDLKRAITAFFDSGHDLPSSGTDETC